MKVITGILPITYLYSTRWLKKKEIKNYEYDIVGKIFEITFTANELTVIRLEKADGISLKKIALPNKAENRKLPRFEKSIAKVRKLRPDPSLLRMPLNNMLPFCISSCFDISNEPSTKSTIGKMKNVVPWDSKSFKLNIDFSNKRNYDEPWVNLHIGSLKNDEIGSFWVFPQSTSKKIKKVAFPFLFKDSQEGKIRFCSIKLETDKWQRIIIEKGRKINKGNLRILGIKKLPEYNKGNKVTFEFNGFCVVSKNHPKFGTSGLRTIRFLSGKENKVVPATEKEAEKTIEMPIKKLIITGTPEKYFEYRYAFSEPVKFEKVSALSKIKGIDLTWHNDAQILEIKGTFPGKDYEVSEKLSKLLTSNEKKTLKEGKAIPIGIKLLYEQ